MKYTHITISREYGSGGRLIAEQAAKKLSIPLYDKKAIQETSDQSGLLASCIEESESRTASLLYNIYLNSQTTTVNDQAFMAQANAIEKLSRQGHSVFLGNCSDYILRDNQNVLKVFIYAPVFEKIERLKSIYGEPDNISVAYLKKYDKKRAAYYNYYAINRQWGEPRNYHLMINSTIGIEESTQLIVNAFLGRR
ncbi:AAA family ATPase [Blautia producta]|uniref:Cytidylate kinase n=1 Tax=Blautia producta TaxID=33035 RepID=A0A4P6M1U7_9FIRM|nr:cytidylate kinase-like family protein [Blautia producta]QBE97307.1 Cytidylate kinase [Blautia producta]